ncbi:uncharacterized protein LOC131016983 isoform X2 [Salvia miltiorrhiza]|uniref:uncharacterized protein LOC131016983 isoform X2 n=1 Tax=Salvia miltiorrhiza TaxID=226208 RepID=UPI0025AC0431|nr:uncharacterized protein LOC131016983 isoform X2 [Salvia miltiorrhiza]
MKAGRTVELILNLAGYRNVKSKVVGSRNPHNTVKALFKALNAVNGRNYIIYIDIVFHHCLSFSIALSFARRLKLPKMFKKSLAELLLNHIYCDRLHRFTKKQYYLWIA